VQEIDVADLTVSTTTSLADGLSIERVQQLYYDGGLSSETLVSTVYKRIGSYSDKAVWITLVPEEEALRRAKALTEQYQDTSSR
jgi:allophanate hydrolase